MKKFKAVAYSAICLCMAISYSCTKELTPVPETEEAVTITLSASPEESSTRVAVDSDNAINWTEGDCISLLNGSENFSLELSEGAGTTSGKFSGEVSAPAAENLEGSFAVYPYSGQNAIDNDILTVYWNGNSTQTAVKNSFDPSSCLMAGVPDSNGNIRFKNIMAYFKFTVDFDFKSVSVNNLAAVPQVMVKFDADGIPEVQEQMMDWNQSGTVTLVGEDGGTIEKGTYLMAVLPQEMRGGFSISFTDDSNKVYTKTTVKSVTLERGHILNIGSFSRSSMIDESSFEGNGTEASPYLITSFQKLKLLEQKISNRDTYSLFSRKYFKQTTDIDCGGQQVHIGHFIKSSSGDHDAPFDGTYDGNGKKITDFYMGMVQMRDSRYACGLFPYVKDATIKHLSVSPHVRDPKSNLIINATEEDNEYVIGCLVGMGTAGYYTSSGTTISDCHVLEGSYQINGIRSTTSLEAYQTVIYGGIVGKSPQKIVISDCSNDASVFVYGGFVKNYATDIEAIAGGIVGMVHNADGANWTSTAEISNCRNTGEIFVETKADDVFSGGIVGYIHDQGFGNSLVHILNCVNSGYVYAYGEEDSTFAGGIIGFNNSDGDVDDNFGSRDPWVYNCLNIGTIEANNGDYCSAAGIIGAGYDSDTEVIYCINTGKIYAESLNSGATVFSAALSGYATALGRYVSAYCIGCYWLYQENNGKVLPILGMSDPEAGDEYKDGDYFDCYRYSAVAESGDGKLSPATINKRIYSGWDSKDSGNACSAWTTAEWRANAAKWIWRNGHLDMDFSQRISSSDFEM